MHSKAYIRPEVLARQPEAAAEEQKRQIKLWRYIIHREKSAHNPRSITHTARQPQPKKKKVVPPFWPSPHHLLILASFVLCVMAISLSGLLVIIHI